MNSLMEKAGERLNLKLHGVGPGGAVSICGPADIEGICSLPIFGLVSILIDFVDL